MNHDGAGARRATSTVVAVLAAWVLTAGLCALLLTQTFSSVSNRWIVSAQALSPYLFPWAAPLAVVALLTRRRGLAVCAGVSVVGFAVLALPLVRHGDPPVVDGDAPTLSVLHANLSADNDEPVQAADTILDAQADVLALSEFTPPVAEALDALGATERYPYRAGVVEEGTDGIAIWSSVPFTDQVVGTIEGRRTVTVNVLVDGRELRVLVVHPAPPFDGPGAETWVPALEAINAEARAGDVPTLLVGDVNASWWHPVFRRTLTDGLVDVHRVLGDGFSVSWPADRGLVPPFTRLDHAFVDDRVQPLGIDDVAIPGSDHEGFVVRVAVGLRE